MSEWGCLSKCSPVHCCERTLIDKVSVRKRGSRYFANVFASKN
jgi:hypothetical protein